MCKLVIPVVIGGDEVVLSSKFRDQNELGAWKIRGLLCRACGGIEG